MDREEREKLLAQFKLQKRRFMSELSPTTDKSVLNAEAKKFFFKELDKLKLSIDDAADMGLIDMFKKWLDDKLQENLDEEVLAGVSGDEEGKDEVEEKERFEYSMDDLNEDDLESLDSTVRAELESYLQAHKLLQKAIGVIDAERIEAIKELLGEEIAKTPKGSAMRIVIRWNLIGKGIGNFSEKDLKNFIEGVLAGYDALSVEESDGEEVIEPLINEEALQNKYGEFSEILTDPIDVVMNHVVTNDYEPTHITKWRVAVQDRAKQLRERGKKYDSDFADVMEILLGGYAFEVFKKGATIDMDHVTIDWEAASKRLSNEKGMALYDSFRRTFLYKYAEDISLKAKKIMEYSKGRWYAAGGNWSNGSELIAKAVSDLMEEGGEFSIFMDKLKSEYPSDEFNSLLIFIRDMGHYETCLRDYRSKIAIKELGIKRSAVKHKTGITAAGSEQPQTFLSKLSYKDGKNNDKGKYATALSWVKLPDDLYNALIDYDDNEIPFDSDENKIPLMHRSRFEDREEEASSYLEYLFGSEDAASAAEEKKWQPKDWEACFPHMDEALDYATAYWVYVTDKSGKKIKKRASEEQIKIFFKDESLKKEEEKKIEIFRDNSLNFEHYEQTWGALNTLYDLASTCWAKSIEHDLAQMTPTEFANKINEEIGKLGTQAAIALAYTLALPDSDLKKGEIFESMRASIDTYIIYLLSQIEMASGLGARWVPYINREYDERYHIAKEEMLTYIENNGSLHKKYINPRTDVERRLSDYLVDTVRDHAFKRKPHGDIDHARTVYNTGKARRDGHSNLVFNMSTEELTSEPKWPYIQKSNTSVQEDGK